MNQQIMCSNLNCVFYNHINSLYVTRFVLCENCFKIFLNALDLNLDYNLKYPKRLDEICRKCKKNKGDAFYICSECHCECELLLKSFFSHSTSNKTLSNSSISDHLSSHLDI